MLKPIGRPDWRGGSLRFIAAESLLLAGLLLLAAYVLWDVGVLLKVQVPTWVARADELALFFVPWQPVLLLSGGLAAYWMLQAMGRDRIAFWLLALAAALPHAMPAWSHNRIGWHVLLDFQTELVNDRSVYLDMILFGACLVGLVALHRLVGMKGLERRMLLRRVEPLDKRRVMRYESLMLIGLLTGGLLLTGLMMLVAALLGRYDGLLDGSPLAIVTLGGGAALLLALTLLFWFRGRQDAQDAQGSMHATDGGT